MQILESDPTDVIVYGHSHRSQSKAIDGILSFNPGKATDSFGILTIGGSNGE
jgi:predicted phosphodiesterase